MVNTIKTIQKYGNMENKSVEPMDIFISVEAKAIMLMPQH